MIDLPSLETERLVLRALEIGDIPTVQRLLDDAELADNMIDVPHPYTRKNAEIYVMWCRDAILEGRSFAMAVVPKDAGALAPSDTLAGYVNLHIYPEHKRGELGYWMGRPYRGRGYTSEAARRLLQFGFERLKLNRVYAFCFTSNRASARVLEKLGMVREGVWQQDVLKPEGFKDVAIYGLLRAEYRKKSDSPG